jgi:hypothetical protein
VAVILGQELTYLSPERTSGLSRRRQAPPPDEGCVEIRHRPETGTPLNHDQCTERERLEQRRGYLDGIS